MNEADEIAEAIVESLIHNRESHGVQFRPGIRAALRQALDDGGDEDAVMAALGRALKAHILRQ